MKMSHVSLLLAIALFVAPVMADTTTETTAADTTAASTTVNTAPEAANTATPAPTSEATTAATPAPAPTSEVVPAQTLAQKATDVIANAEAKEKTIMAAITAALFTTAPNTVLNGLDKVAHYTFVTAALDKLATFGPLSGTFKNNIPSIQKAIVVTALAGLGYAAYQAYTNQNTEDFDADFDADNN